MLFQSLFFWKWGFKFYDGLITDDDGIGFNPCFSGSGVLRARLSVAPDGVMGFNPCFSGSGVLSATAMLQFERGHRVSILVFLEVGF